MRPLTKLCTENTNILPPTFFLEILNVKASDDTFENGSSFLCQLYRLKPTRYFWDFFVDKIAGLLLVNWVQNQSHFASLGNFALRLKIMITIFTIL